MPSIHIALRQDKLVIVNQVRRIGQPFDVLVNQYLLESWLLGQELLLVAHLGRQGCWNVFWCIIANEFIKIIEFLVRWNILILLHLLNMLLSHGLIWIYSAGVAFSVMVANMAFELKLSLYGQRIIDDALLVTWIPCWEDILQSLIHLCPILVSLLDSQLSEQDWIILSLILSGYVRFAFLWNNRGLCLIEISALLMYTLRWIFQCLRMYIAQWQYRLQVNL